MAFQHLDRVRIKSGFYKGKEATLNDAGPLGLIYIVSGGTHVGGDYFCAGVWFWQIEKITQ